jgi:adenylosuccinate synthase
MIHPHTVGAIGNGVVINPATLLAEMDMLRQAGIEVTPQRLRISHAAHIITPAHRALDEAQEKARGAEKIGTTLRGIGPAYTDKTSRAGIRMENMLDPELFAGLVEAHTKEINHQLTKLYDAEPLDPLTTAAEMFEFARRLAPYIEDVSALLDYALKNGKRVLAEGAQGTLLDIDHGTYPYVTSSNSTAPGALTGLGIGVGCVERVVGVTKAFQTRVGSGTFPSEVEGEIAQRLRGTGSNPWDEYGTTTGRPRRVGWIDLVLLRYAARINGLTELAVTKLDVLSGLHPIRICTRYCRENCRDHYPFANLPLGPSKIDDCEPVYEEMPGWDDDISSVRTWEDLPAQARSYILKIEDLSEVPVRMVSVGPEREQIVEIT